MCSSGTDAALLPWDGSSQTPTFCDIFRSKRCSEGRPFAHPYKVVESGRSRPRVHGIQADRVVSGNVNTALNIQTQVALPGLVLQTGCYSAREEQAAAAAIGKHYEGTGCRESSDYSG